MFVCVSVFAGLRATFFNPFPVVDILCVWRGTVLSVYELLISAGCRVVRVGNPRIGTGVGGVGGGGGGDGGGGGGKDKTF